MNDCNEWYCSDYNKPWKLPLWLIGIELSATVLVIITPFVENMLKDIKNCDKQTNYCIVEKFNNLGIPNLPLHQVNCSSHNKNFEPLLANVTVCLMTCRYLPGPKMGEILAYNSFHPNYWSQMTLVIHVSHLLISTLDSRPECKNSIVYYDFDFILQRITISIYSHLPALAYLRMV